MSTVRLQIHIVPQPFTNIGSVHCKKLHLSIHLVNRDGDLPITQRDLNTGRLHTGTKTVPGLKSISVSHDCHSFDEDLLITRFVPTMINMGLDCYVADVVTRR